MNVNKYLLMGIVVIFLVVVIVVIGVIRYVSGGDEVDKIIDSIETNEEIVDLEGKEDDDFDNDDVEQIVGDFIGGYDLTEDESRTILKDRATEPVMPEKGKDMLYIFYDREKQEGNALIDIAEEFIESTGIDYTIYHINSETGLVQGKVLLDELGYEYNYEDENVIVMILYKKGEERLVMSTDNLSEVELYDAWSGYDG